MACVCGGITYRDDTYKIFVVEFLLCLVILFGESIPTFSSFHLERVLLFVF